MIKHVNFTGRRRIPRKRVCVDVHDGTPRSFDATIDLAEMRFPPDAKVYLEAMCAGSAAVHRYDFGSVGCIVPPADRRLTELEGEHVFFTLKVVDRTQRVGRILGISENIRPQRAGQRTAAGRRGILPIETADLGQELWRLEFREHDVFLLVNKHVAGLKERAQADPFFCAAVYPAVVRMILTRAIEDNAEAEEESDRWPALWLRFGRGLHPERQEPPKSEDSQEDRERWIDEVVEAFCNQHQMRERFIRRAEADKTGEL